MAMSNWSPSCATSVHRKQCGDVSCVNAFNKGCCDLLKSECVIPSKPLCRYLQKQCFVPGRGPYYYCDTDRTVLRKHHHNFKALKLCLPDTFFLFRCDGNYASASGSASMQILREPTCQSTLRRRGCDQLGHSPH
jgi:hypothetical protein